MDFDFHQISRWIQGLTQVIIDLHVLALVIVNVTETPRRKLRDSGSYTAVNPFYRAIELLAGIITPLAKK